ncbi:MAG: inorganic phosphate transporter [Gemmatimonadetes bacterium]|nr:inorganic phosphate transporter [Gemmatimonadota bacterium]MBT5586521.1 inorganic phosphate transporter [Gemmatimonadota bacterium]MBT5960506.1 inorganic phosphate transporter [Gemmatimonadota bacterium]MBT6628072.1 inorganic phosphate transporter [Gemmatimonadota bacterium]MBT7454578.1 inorganic phosphate transporter [Gemmatimonadota bacterium]
MFSELFFAVAVGAVFLTYANGANDNFKGVATLYGSGVLSYRAALVSGTTATWFGSVAALFIADELVRSFSGKGLVDPAILAQGTFPVAVAGGAAVTVLLATRLGLPISTTHALIGALVGAGLSAGSLNAARLGTAFALPLAISPLLAATLAAAVYLTGRTLRRHWQLEADDCLCLEPALQPAVQLVSQPIKQPISQSSSQSDPMTATTVSVSESSSAGAPPGSAGAARVTPSVHSAAMPGLRIGNVESCSTGPLGSIGVSAVDGVGILHCLSGLLVSFARGLNDTPKIAGVLLIGSTIAVVSQQWLIVAIASVMALGGLLSARRVAQVMAKDITTLNEGQGLAANLVTSFLVLGASKFGVPVSTTHVSCGALFGIGASTRGGHVRTIITILGAWLITLPLGAASAAIIYYLTQTFLQP